MNKYIFGAYGTNNIGDDMIFDGANTVYNNKLIPIHVNTGNRPGSLSYADFFNNVIEFDNTIADELIMGGGGLLHCKSATEDYLKMAKLAKAKGLRFSIQRIGTSGFSSDFIKVTKELLSEAYFISVRNETSKKIINDLGFYCTVEKDFAYEYTPIISNPIKLPNMDRPTIILAFGPTNYNKLKNIMDYLLNYVNVVQVLHSNKNDTILSSESKNFVELPYIDNLADISSLYKEAKGVLSLRYHGFILADKYNKPLLGLTQGLKTDSFFDHAKNPKHKNINIEDITQSNLDDFIQLVNNET